MYCCPSDSGVCVRAVAVRAVGVGGKLEVDDAALRQQADAVRRVIALLKSPRLQQLMSIRSNPRCAVVVAPSRFSCLLICLHLAATCCFSVVVSSSSSLLLVLLVLLLLLLCMPPVVKMSCPCRWRCLCSYVDRLEQSLQQRVAQLSKLRGRLNDVVYRHGELVDSVARVQPQLDAKVAEVLQLKASVEADVAALYSKPVHLVGAINALK